LKLFSDQDKYYCEEISCKVMFVGSEIIE